MDSSILITEIVIGLAAGCGGVLIGSIIKKASINKSLELSHGTANDIIANARREADNTMKEAELKIKDDIFQSKADLEVELKERRGEILNLEKRLLSKEEGLDSKFSAYEKRETELLNRERALDSEKVRLREAEAKCGTILEEQQRKLESIAGLSAEDAKQELISEMEAEAKLEAGKRLLKVEEELKEQVDEKSRDIICTAIQRYAGDYVVERTVSVVNLPSDEMKGRIIGREGRNIRAIEAATGIDIIIDDTPGAVILSGHNPVRREVAKIALERLIADGRIHPSRIEEVVNKVEEEVDKTISEFGEKAIFDTGIHGVHKEIQKLIGRLKYRTSYTQNVYAHSLEVSFLCGVMASELGLSTKIARRAGLLHDIGKSIDHEVEGPHAKIGGDFAKKYGEDPLTVSAIASHHDDSPESIYGVLVQAADTLSAARPGARREMLESYVQRLDDLEEIAGGFNGVDKTYALQAGREVRVMVENKDISDEGALTLSKDIARKIESDLSYPGQIKVTVIRETRSVDYAK